MAEVRNRVVLVIGVTVAVIAVTGVVGYVSGVRTGSRTEPGPMGTAFPTEQELDAILERAADDPDAGQSDPPEIPRRGADEPCAPIHFGFAGKPKKYWSDTLGSYEVPTGREWHITNTSLLAERHSGGPKAVAGEWTVQAGGFDEAGRFTIAQASLDNGSGIAVGQGQVDVALASGTELIFNIWLRPGTDPVNYYYTVAASGMDCSATEAP
jgi:hypothetical protein